LTLRIQLCVAPWLHFPGSTGSNEHKGDEVAKEDRGFASMDRARQREIASKGGKAAHQKGTAHEWTSEEARDAGRKGGLASHRRRREQKEGQGGEGDGNDEMVGAHAGNSNDEQ
jgi:general stress protein YciG